MKRIEAGAGLPPAPSDLSARSPGVATGPLSQAILAADDDPSTRFGNALIFSFAGHDTTGHTMTWLTFELCKAPHYQRRVQAEVDALFAGLAAVILEALVTVLHLARVRVLT
jgi:cytochrome P450